MEECTIVLQQESANVPTWRVATREACSELGMNMVDVRRQQKWRQELCVVYQQVSLDKLAYLFIDLNNCKMLPWGT